MWKIPTATSSALAAVRRQTDKAMDPTGLTYISVVIAFVRCSVIQTCCSGDRR